MLIKTDIPASEQKGFNENTLEWKGRKLKDLQSTELIDIIVNFLQINIALRTKVKEFEDINRIIQPFRN